MKKTVLALMIAVVVAGCNSRPKKIRKAVSRVVAGRNVPTHAIQTVRGYEIVKEYGLGRRIDPNNPNIMYGPCKMYVIRRSPTWNLRPNTPVDRPVLKKRKKRINPLKIKFENMKKQQDLMAKKNKILEKIGIELLEVSKELQATNEKKEDLLSDIKQIKESQGKVKRKMAELEQ